MDIVKSIEAIKMNNNNSNNSNNNNNSNNFDSNHMQQVESIEVNKGYTYEEQFRQLYEISNDPKRKEFLDDLFQFMADKNQPINRIPIMAKQVLDLYELYNLVVARGGLVEVINKKIWREITKGLNLPSSITSAAFTLRTQYMRYLYLYECAKNNFSNQEELQQAIDGNRREGRRAGSGTGLGAYASFMGPNSAEMAQLSSGYAAAAAAAAAAHQLSHQQQHHLSQVVQSQQLNQSLHNPSGQHIDQSAGSTLYQDSIESDHDVDDEVDDDSSIDLDHSPKIQNQSPINLDNQHLDSHINSSNSNTNTNTNTNSTSHHHHHSRPYRRSQTQANDHNQQQLAAAAAAAAAIRQQLGAAFGLAGNQSFISQLSGHLNLGNSTTNTNSHSNNISNPLNAPNNQANTNNNPLGSSEGDFSKQQQEQFLAALMSAAAANQNQSQPQTNQSNGSNPENVAARAALSSMASNALIIAASNAPDAMAMATAAQAIGVKGAFVILLL